jgi:Putative binding domain, N-terminal/Viral BACON domain
MSRIRLSGLAILTLLSAAVAVRCDHATPVQPTNDCTATTAPTSLSFEAVGSSGAVQLLVAPGCAWTATATTPWVTVTSPSTGNGPGTIAIAVASNAADSDRTGTLALAGKSVPITQRGIASQPTCTYALSAELLVFPRAGASGAVTVTAPSGCAWTAESTPSWITLGAGRTGSGSGSVSYTVAANTEAASRTGTVIIAGRSLTVIQDGNEGVCTYSAATTEFTSCNAATVLETTLTTQAACPWTAAPDASWISIQSAMSGTGPAVIRFAVAANDGAPRQGKVNVRWPDDGLILHVSQGSCHYALSSSAFSIPVSGGAFGFDVLQVGDSTGCGGGPCVWSPAPDVSWILITSSTPQSGDGSVGFTVQANTTSAVRTGTIVVGDRTVHITQAGS